MVDGLESWWHDHAHQHPDVEELALNVDKGPSVQRHRTQFIRRMVALSHKTGLRSVWISYPPYHSKYHPIERCWAALENSWDGAILSTVDTAVQWAANRQWKGSAPVIHLVEKVYEKGIRVGQEVLEELQQCWKRSETLPKWDVVIEPT